MIVGRVIFLLKYLVNKNGYLAEINDTSTEY